MHAIPRFRSINWNDARYLQIFLLSAFLIYGTTWLGWHNDLAVYAAAFASTLLTQYFWSRYKNLPDGTWKSAMISALGLCLLLKVNFWPYMLLAGILTVSSKFLITVRGKHIFNPTNLGIVAILLTGNGWISPGQWGSGEVVGLLVVLGAAGVLFRVNRWDVSLAFLSSLILIEYLRTVVYLGWGPDVLWHKFSSGTILLFAFFMITDPRTAPDHRMGRVLWGSLIALLSFALTQFWQLYQAPILALFIISAFTPLFDKLFRAERFQWAKTVSIITTEKPNQKLKIMKTRVIATALAMLVLLPESFAFCGFYVAKAPANLFNHKSEVILVRDGNHTVITMSNDFQGDVAEFAMVVPVPVVLRRDQIKVVDRGVFDRLDAYSAPRVVEYHDENPCNRYEYEMLESVSMKSRADMASAPMMEDDSFDKKHHVKVEARYTVGEYDILLLSASESDGLEKWLVASGYRIPAKASEILKPYILSSTKFFVVKVNLENQKRMGFDNLRPIQLSFESDKFMLPIRLGMANAENAQDLVVYAFTRTGRIEPVNYRTVKVPTDREVPLFVQNYFGEFYKDLFDKAYNQERRSAVFLEYAWNVSPMQGVKCDPCVSPPPVFDDFAEAGVNWVSGMNQQSTVFFTRLHVRYTRDKFPQDLLFQVTPNSENFQARYVTRHPAQGDLSCSAGADYRESLENRRRNEVDELAALAGWTNPNYAQYINEFSLNTNDKYKPVKEDFAPVVGNNTHNNDDGPGGAGRLWMLGVLLLGLFSLFALQQKQKTKVIG